MESSELRDIMERIARAQEKLLTNSDRLVAIGEEELKMHKDNHDKFDRQFEQRDKALDMMNKLNIDPEALNQSMKQVADMMGSYSEERDEFKKKLSSGNKK